MIKKIILKELIVEFQRKDLYEVFERYKKLDFLKIQKSYSIIWPRRSWKTSLCFLKIGELLKKWISKKNILYLNFENERLLDFSVDDFQNLFESFLEISDLDQDKDKIFIFLDEVQNITFWEKFVTRILEKKNITIVVTWSSSKMLSKEISTELRWKNLSLEILPLNFEEYLSFIWEEWILLNKKWIYDFSKKQKYIKIFKNFLFFWWFPEIVLTNWEKEKKELSKSYYDTIFYKDIIERNKIRSIQKLKQVRKFLSYEFTTNLSLNNKSKDLWIQYSNLHEWTWFFQDSYFWFFLQKFDFSLKKSENSLKKFYLIDNSFYYFNFWEFSPNYWKLFENLVFLEFRKKWFIENENIFYYSDNKIWEIDFVIFNSWKISCYQVCWNIEDKKTFDREISSLKNVKDKFQVEDINLIVWEWVFEIEKKDWINIIPFFHFVKNL